MPVRLYIILILVFLVSPVLVAIAGFYDSPIYLHSPHHLYSRANWPCPPWLLGGIMAVAVISILLMNRAGAVIYAVLALVLAFAVFKRYMLNLPMPGLFQYLLILSLAGAACYAWVQKYYLEE